jgi:cytochrome c oxidase subunit I+III
MKLDVCPPPGASLPAGGAVPATVLLLAATALMAWAARRAARPGHGLLNLAVVLATVGSIAALVIDLTAHLQAGLAPRHHAWSATVGALLAWQGLHAFVLLLMGAYLVVRSLAGRLRPDARATLDHCALFWHYVTVQGIATVVLVRFLPQWMGG